MSPGAIVGDDAVEEMEELRLTDSSPDVGTRSLAESELFFLKPQRLWLGPNDGAPVSGASGISGWVGAASASNINPQAASAHSSPSPPNAISLLQPPSEDSAEAAVSAKSENFPLPPKRNTEAIFPWAFVEFLRRQ